ncbi:MAG: cation transporter [Candidatus Micrarchaeota archaeon]
MVDFKVSGMHCDSCAKIIQRSVACHEGASVVVDASGNRVQLDCSPEQLAAIRQDLLAKGYQLLSPGEEAGADDGARFEAGSARRVLAFFSGILAGGREFAFEHRLLKTAVAALAVVLAAQAVLYFMFFHKIPGFLATYSSVLFLTAVSIVALVFAVYHAEAFRRKASCMTGMMTGMTFGMAGGFLVGAFAGAANGMFVGSLVGMAAGMALGYLTGRCCGVMGVMEGVMGGLMAGTMGAMLSVMLAFDHLILFLFILTGVELALIASSSYMLYKEYGRIEEGRVKIGFFDFVAISLACYLVLTAVFIYGPKAGVVLGA